MKKLTILFLFFLVPTLFAQDITNTIDAGGIFYVKDGSTNYFTITQSTGQVNVLKSLRLELTGNSSTTGVLFKGTDRFIHDFKPTNAFGFNTFIGINSGNFTMSYSSGSDASFNTALGNFSLNKLTTGYNNTASGYRALYSNTTGYRNTASGYFALSSNTTGYYNTASGSFALSSNTTGYHNTASGYYALYSNTTGRYNTASGYLALRSNTTGNYNTASGYRALYNSTGGSNTAVGYYAGNTLTTGTNNSFLGFQAEPSSATVSDEITLGNSSIATLRCNVQTITSLSDIRDKKNITNLSLGLDFLMKLQPRQFNWDKREWYKDNKSDGTKMKEIPTAGFIAQELDKVQKQANADWLNLVYKSNPNKWEATYGNLLPVIVKAVQQLKLQNDKLSIENTQLKKQVAQFGDFEKEINEIKQIKAEFIEQLKFVKEFNKKEKVEIVSVGN